MHCTWRALCLVLTVWITSGSFAAPSPLPDDLAEAEAFALGYQAVIVGVVYALEAVDKACHKTVSCRPPA